MPSYERGRTLRPSVMMLEEEWMGRLMAVAGVDSGFMDEVMSTFNTVLKKDIRRPKSFEKLMAVCVSAVSIKNGITHDEGELVKISGIDGRKFRKHRRAVLDVIGRSRIGQADRMNELIHQICKKLSLGKHIAEAASTLYKRIRNEDETFITNPRASAPVMVMLCDGDYGNTRMSKYVALGMVTYTTMNANKKKITQFILDKKIKIPEPLLEPKIQISDEINSKRKKFNECIREIASNADMIELLPHARKKYGMLFRTGKFDGYSVGAQAAACMILASNMGDPDTNQKIIDEAGSTLKEVEALLIDTGHRLKRRFSGKAGLVEDLIDQYSEELGGRQKFAGDAKALFYKIMDKDSTFVSNAKETAAALLHMCDTLRSPHSYAACANIKDIFPEAERISVFLSDAYPDYPEWQYTAYMERIKKVKSAITDTMREIADAIAAPPEVIRNADLLVDDILKSTLRPGLSNTVPGTVMYVVAKSYGIDPIKILNKRWITTQMIKRSILNWNIRPPKIQPVAAAHALAGEICRKNGIQNTDKIHEIVDRTYAAGPTSIGPLRTAAAAVYLFDSNSTSWKIPAYGLKRKMVISDSDAITRHQGNPIKPDIKSELPDPVNAGSNYNGMPEGKYLIPIRRLERMRKIVPILMQISSEMEAGQHVRNNALKRAASMVNAGFADGRTFVMVVTIALIHALGKKGGRQVETLSGRTGLSEPVFKKLLSKSARYAGDSDSDARLAVAALARQFCTSAGIGHGASCKVGIMMRRMPDCGIMMDDPILAASAIIYLACPKKNAIISNTSGVDTNLIIEAAQRLGEMYDPRDHGRVCKTLQYAKYNRKSGIARYVNGRLVKTNDAKYCHMRDLARRMADAAGMDEGVVKNAMDIYAVARDDGYIKGDMRADILAACLSIASGRHVLMEDKTMLKKLPGGPTMKSIIIREKIEKNMGLCAR